MSETLIPKPLSPERLAEIEQQDSRWISRGELPQMVHELLAAVVYERERAEKADAALKKAAEALWWICTEPNTLGEAMAHASEHFYEDYVNCHFRPQENP